MFDMDLRPRPLGAIGFQLETTTSLGSGEPYGRIIFEQEGRGRVQCTVRGEDVAYLEDIGRQVMAGSRIRELEAEHAALLEFTQALFPGLKLVEQEVNGKPAFLLQWKRS